MSKDLLTEVSRDILNRTEFQEDFIQLTQDEFVDNYGQNLGEGRIVRLLESSAVMSLSNDDIHKTLAYKIAVYLFRQYGASYSAIPYAAELILTRMGDLPIIEQMIRNDAVPDFFAFIASSEASRKSMSSGFAGLPVALRFPEILRKKAFNQVEIAKNQVLTLTDFQSNVLHLLQERNSVAFSAPTSAGKSYLLLNYIASRLMSSEEYCAIYIVPTKALIAEFQADVMDHMVGLGAKPSEFIVFTGSSFLGENEMKSAKKKVFVLTQERLQDMLANQQMNFDVDLLVVDEAQQVAAEDRGVIVEDAVQELLARNPRAQKVFISPYVSNLDIYERVFEVPAGTVTLVSTTKSPVAQNIVLVTFKKGLPKGVHAAEVSVLLRELRENGRPRRVVLMSDLPYETALSTNYMMKAWVAVNVVPPQEPTLIYSNGPHECRKVGEELARLSSEKKMSSPRIVEAISFLKEHVHPEYYLVDALPHGVGYHYGTMPQFVRFLVKDLFESQEITFLACTSTLLEGVNLPAKNIVLYKPRRGRDKPMDTLSIRNLVGRAGRLRNDYYGKIYCINIEEWEQGEEAFEEKEELVESSSEQALSQKMDELISYLRDTSVDVNKGVKTLGTSLLMKQLLHPDKDFLSRFKNTKTIDQTKLLTVKSLLVEKTAGLVLSKDIILRNRSFDPRNQDRLYHRLKKLSRRPLPRAPQRDWSATWNDLLPLFERISVDLLGEKSFSYKYYTVLAAKWASEIPYRRILDDQIAYGLRRELRDGETERRAINKIIEDVDEALEKVIRFNYTRGLKCYCDIIGGILSEEGSPLEYCANLPLYVESGTSDSHTLYLMAAGLSRNTAIEIRNIFGEGVSIPRWASVGDALAWLRVKAPILAERLHAIQYREVSRLIQ